MKFGLETYRGGGDWVNLRVVYEQPLTPATRLKVRGGGWVRLPGKRTFYLAWNTAEKRWARGKDAQKALTLDILGDIEKALMAKLGELGL